MVMLSCLFVLTTVTPVINYCKYGNVELFFLTTVTPVINYCKYGNVELFIFSHYSDSCNKLL